MDQEKRKLIEALEQQCRNMEFMMSYFNTSSFEGKLRDDIASARKLIAAATERDEA